MRWIIIIHARRTGRLFWSRATGQLRKEKWRPRSRVVWPFRFSLQQGAIEYLTPIVAGRVTAYIQELEILACAFVWRKTNFPFRQLMSRSHIRIIDNRGPPWSGPARIFFFACSISSEGNLVASLVQILEEYSCFFRSLFLLALLLWKQAASLVQMLEIFARFFGSLFLLALSSQRKAASSVHILEISLASDSEASFFLLLKFSEGNLQV